MYSKTIINRKISQSYNFIKKKSWQITIFTIITKQ